MDALPVIQTAALGGTPAVVFLITLPAATAALAVARGRMIERPLLAYGLPLLLVLSAIGYVSSDHRDNRAWLFDRNGDRIVDYAKRHLVPIGEFRFRPGDRDAVIAIDGHTVGVAICKDMDFPRLARGYGRAAVQTMLTPAWNLDVDDVYHARMAVLRGVEQGFSVIRAVMLSVGDA